MASFVQYSSINKYNILKCKYKKWAEGDMKTFSKLKNLKTLLVDDDEMIRDALAVAFESKGCCLKTYENAEKGLQALEEERFDIIICDFMLPGMDGVEFFKLVGSCQSHILKILISGYGNKELNDELSRIGVHAFIQKPFSVKQLINSLVHLAEDHQKKNSGDLCKLTGPLNNNITYQKKTKEIIIN